MKNQNAWDSLEGFWAVLGFGLAVAWAFTPSPPAEAVDKPPAMVELKVPEGKPSPEETAVSKDIINSTGTVLVDQTVINQSMGSGIMVSIYPSGLRTGISTDEIRRWYEAESGGTFYRKIELKNGFVLNVTETFDQIRIKLQNAGWLIY